MKAVAVQHIVLIILGVIVIGLLGYLFYTTFIKGRSAIESNECLAERLSYCSGQTNDFEKVNKACGNAYTKRNVCEGLPFNRSSER